MQQATFSSSSHHHPLKLTRTTREQSHAHTISLSTSNCSSTVTLAEDPHPRLLESGYFTYVAVNQSEQSFERGGHLGGYPKHQTQTVIGGAWSSSCDICDTLGRFCAPAWGGTMEAGTGVNKDPDARRSQEEDSGGQRGDEG